MPSVREIAALAGVSTSTVSLVLNNKPGVSAAMRRQVLDAVEQLHSAGERRPLRAEAPSALESDLPARDLSVVVLHPPILRSSQVFSEFLQGVQEGATRYRLHLRLAVNEPELPESHVSRLYFTDDALRPDGVLIIGAQQEEPILALLHSLAIPFVLIGRQTREPHIAAVGRDEEQAASQATRYLLGLGHRAIAFLGGDERYGYVQGRLCGYRRALAEQVRDAPARWIALGPGRAAAERILQVSPEITAAIFINDAYALEGLPAFQAAGWAIPADLSVISFDDTDEARNFEPPLTSVSYPRVLEGYWATRLLYEQIRQPLIQSGQIIFRPSFIVRDSCAPPPAGARLKRELNP